MMSPLGKTEVKSRLFPWSEISMSAASQYWTFLRLGLSGQTRPRSYPETQAFLEKFTDAIAETPFPHSQIQRQLFIAMKDAEVAPESSGYRQTQWCLRCFISQRIVQTCAHLVKNRGRKHHFNLVELLIIVLDDDGQPFQTKPVLHPETQEPIPHYRSVAQHSLETYQPHKGSLSSWVTRLVRQHRDMTQFLLERGLYLVSDWAVLNDTSENQLYRILTRNYQHSPEQAEQTCLLVKSYWEIYLPSRRPNTPCTPPTETQWQQMTENFQAKTGRSLAPEEFAQRLAQVAFYLRQYRIQVRSGKLLEFDHAKSSEDLEHLIDHITLKEANLESSNEDETAIKAMLLMNYAEMFQTAFERAIAAVIEQRYQTLLLSPQKRTRDKAEKYIHAMRLFYGERMSMSEIAPLIQLKRQDEVTRLIAPTQMRADTRRLTLHGLLQTLRQELIPHQTQEEIQIAILAIDTLFDQLNTDQELPNDLTQSIDELIQEEAKRTRTIQAFNQSTRFSEAIRQYLDKRVTNDTSILHMIPHPERMINSP
jgi:predicted DNA-binding protein YlxM (UPF0122 family)